jgi:hypothetical protein
MAAVGMGITQDVVAGATAQGRALNALVKQMTSRRAADRPQSMASVVLALRGL